MKAITLVPHTKKVQLADWPEPQIEKPTQVKVRVLEVGICGTDREEVFGGRADAPPHAPRLDGFTIIREVRTSQAVPP